MTSTLRYNLPESVWPGEPECLVTYGRDPGQRGILYPTDRAQPFIPPHVVIVSVVLGGIELGGWLHEYHPNVEAAIVAACEDMERRD